MAVDTASIYYTLYTETYFYNFAFENAICNIYIFPCVAPTSFMTIDFSMDHAYFAYLNSFHVSSHANLDANAIKNIRYGKKSQFRVGSIGVPRWKAFFSIFLLYFFPLNGFVDFLKNSCKVWCKAEWWTYAQRRRREKSKRFIFLIRARHIEKAKTGEKNLWT